MKTKLSLLTALFASISIIGSAQINLGKVIDRSIKKAERSIENRVGNRIDKTVDKSLDAVEDSVFGSGKTKSNNDATSKSITKSQKKSSQVNDSENSTEMAEQTKPALIWSKYDFVQGTEIIFEDDFVNEQNGEFPSRWDMTKGAIEMTEWGGEKVVWFKKTNANVPDAMLPLLKNRTSDYLPEQFTVEMDVYFHKEVKLNSNYYLFLYDLKNQTKIMKLSAPIRIDYNSITYDLTGDTYPGQDKLKPAEGWRHIALSFNTRALKGYLDDVRVLNLPNLEINPTGIMISAHNVSGKGKPFVKNVRIAKGAVPLYDKFLTDGKFVTTGIRFDINKATIKPESMGTINYVLKMMTDHPELKFSVEGHTDSDGEPTANQKLSEARAQAILDVLVKAGINADRLKSKGWGESKPMADNDTPVGKAQNRRVEFVKIQE